MKELTSEDLYSIIANPNVPYVKLDSHTILYEAYEFGGQTWVWRFADPERRDHQLIALCPSPLDAIGIMHNDWTDIAFGTQRDREYVNRISYVKKR